MAQQGHKQALSEPNQQKGLGDSSVTPHIPWQPLIQTPGQQWVTDTALAVSALSGRSSDALTWFVGSIAKLWWAGSLTHPSALLRQSWSRLGRQDAQALSDLLPGEREVQRHWKDRTSFMFYRGLNSWPLKRNPSGDFSFSHGWNNHKE